MFATGDKCYSLKANHEIFCCIKGGVVCATGDKCNCLKAITKFAFVSRVRW